MRLAVIELRGADIRLRRERELIWWGANLPYLKKAMPLDKFVGKPQEPKDRVREFHAAWDLVDRALARGNARAR